MYKLRLQYSDGTPKMYTFDFVYGTYKTKKEAGTANLNENISVYLSKRLGGIFIYDHKTESSRILFSDIKVTKLSDEAIQRMGEPLLVGDYQTKDISIDALKNKDPQYNVWEDDFINVESDLCDIAKAIYTDSKDYFIDGEHYQLSSISYNIEEVQSECS